MIRKNLNEGLLKKLLTLLVFFCRIILFVFILVWSGLAKLTEQEFKLIICLVLPITLLYFTLVLKYLIVHKRYFPSGQLLANGYFFLSSIPIVLFTLLELTLISCKAELFDDIENLYLGIALLEAAFACYAGANLSSLFARAPQTELKK